VIYLKQIECYLIKHPSVKESYEDVYKEICKEIQLFLMKISIEVE